MFVVYYFDVAGWLVLALFDLPVCGLLRCFPGWVWIGWVGLLAGVGVWYLLFTFRVFVIFILVILKLLLFVNLGWGCFGWVVSLGFVSWGFDVWVVAWFSVWVFDSSVACDSLGCVPVFDDFAYDLCYFI